jgi:hypothetical protein
VEKVLSADALVVLANAERAVEAASVGVFGVRLKADPRRDILLERDGHLHGHGRRSDGDLGVGGAVAAGGRGQGKREGGEQYAAGTSWLHGHGVWALGRPPCGGGWL